MSDAKKGKPAHNCTKIKRICTGCGNEYTTQPSQNIKFCSRKCYDAFRRVTVNCIICKNTFTKPKSNKKVTCSKKCSKQLSWRKRYGKNCTE